jgi:DNA-binding CsgD family transcriptional regulator/predicted negative regulator of RcsB-dependent stress response
LALALSAAPPSEVEQAIDLAVRDGSLLAEIGPGSSTWNLAIQALRFVDSHRFAESLLTIGMRSANAESASAARAFPEHAWAYWHLDFGLIPQAVSHAEKALGAIEGTGLPISELSIVAPLIEALIWAGNLDEASRFAETAIEPATGTFVEPFVLVARAMARVAAGRSDAAEEDLRRAVRIGSDRRWSAPRVTRARQRLAELLVDRGDAEEALELLQPDLEAAERIGSPGTRGIAMRCQALTLSGPARLEMQECAVGLLNQSPLRLDLARGLVDLAGTLLSQGDVEQARTAYRRALASAQSAGSKLVFQRAANGLREAGGRMRRTDFDGPGSLTDKELETARLAARGLSNREIAQSLWVTGKTIEFHLTNVYRKLGISSRSQLAGRLEEEPADLRPPGSVIPHR